MTPFFATPARLAALDSAAAAWLGTPYVQSGAVRGYGASCHRLAGAVLADAGFLLPPVPERGATRLREYTASMRAWLDGAPVAFAPIPLPVSSAEPLTPHLQPGDVLLCEIGIGHIALYLGDPGARVLQVLRQSPAHCVCLHDPQVRRYVLAAYRPIIAS